MLECLSAKPSVEGHKLDGSRKKDAVDKCLKMPRQSRRGPPRENHKVPRE
jgi:hypothetical protein